MLNDPYMSYFFRQYFTLVTMTSVIEYLLFDTPSSSELSITRQVRRIEISLPPLWAGAWSRRERFILLACSGLVLQPGLPSNYEGKLIPPQEFAELIYCRHNLVERATQCVLRRE